MMPAAVRPAVMVVGMVRAAVVVMVIPRTGRRRRHAAVHGERRGHIHTRHGYANAGYADGQTDTDGNANTSLGTFPRTAHG